MLFGFQVLSSSRIESSLEVRFRDLLYVTALSWFSARPLYVSQSAYHSVC